MLKKLLFLFALTLLILPAFAQEAPDATTAAVTTTSQLDRSNHPDYLRSVELRELSRAALEAGNYAESIRLSNEAIAALDRFRGNNGINLARAWLRTARERGLDVSMAERYAQALEFTDAAADALVMGNFEDSITNSDRAIAILRAMLGERGVHNLVDSYTVVWGDSLWRIANKPEIYDDKFAWPRLWQANRSRLRDPENPHLIFPDQVFTIPR